jgi:hypothetical protein
MNIELYEQKLNDGLKILDQMKGLKALDNGDKYFADTIASTEHRFYCHIKSMNDLVEEDLAKATGGTVRIMKDVHDDLMSHFTRNTM